MGLSRLEVNLRRLLIKCELMVKNNQKDDERFPKYIASLSDMLKSLEETTDSDNINDYSRRFTILTNLISDKTEAESNETVTESNDSCKDIPTFKRLSTRDELLGTKSHVRHRSKTTDDLDEVLDYHKNMQDKIAEDMLLLTRNLKEQSVLANRIIKQDTDTVTKSSHLTEKNFSKLKTESEKLAEHSKRACKCWMWIMLIIVMVLFINMVLFMKVMKKRI